MAKEDIQGRVISAVSGETIIITSGVGIVVNPSAGVVTRARLACTANSGGTTLVSGLVRSATVKSLAVSGALYIGGNTGVDMPYSGYGLCLAAGEAITLDVNNFNLISVCAAISGDQISYIGVS